MGDHNDGHFVFFQLTDDLIQFFCFFYSKCCCRFVKNNNGCMIGKCLQNFDQLPLSNAVMLQQRLWIKINPQFIHQFFCFPVDPSFFYKTAFGFIPSNKNIFRDCHLFNLDQFLLYHAHPIMNGVYRLSDTHRLTININLAFRRLLDPCKDLHQCRFPCTVFPAQAKNLSPPEMKADIIQCMNPAKAFTDIFHFQYILTHCCPSCLIYKKFILGASFITRTFSFAFFTKKKCFICNKFTISD